MSEFKEMQFRFEDDFNLGVRVVDKLESLGYVFNNLMFISGKNNNYIITSKSGKYYFREYGEDIENECIEDFLSDKPKSGDWVWVKDSSSSEWNKRIFLTEIKDAKFPFIVVTKSNEDKFRVGGEFRACPYEQMCTAKPEKDIPKKEIPEYTMEEAVEKMGHEFKIKNK